MIGCHSSNFSELLSILEGHIIFTEHEDGRINRDLGKVRVEL